jgi:hypothetical protein
MPTAVENLTKDSSDEESQKAISSCISQLADEHPDWSNERRVAACYNMARERTGKTLGRKG